MSRKAFHQLLKRYVDGKCSDEEKRLIDYWYQLLDDNSLMPISEQQMNNIEERLWNKIHTNISIKNKNAHNKIYSIVLKLSVAAAVVVLVALGIYYLLPSKTTKENFKETASIEGLQQIKNETSTVKKIELEDGSMVSLQPGAALAFPKKFAADKREVFLEGVAFFKVSKNAERPFYVYDDNIITQVLGTSFYIKKVNNQIEVDVLTGRVAVFENNKEKNENKPNGVVITPNQKVTYTANHQFVTALVENPVPVPSENKEAKEKPTIKFLYDDALVSQVLNDLEQQYKIEFIVQNEKINQCYFTGDINEQTLYSKLDLLCEAIQAHYEIRGTTIVIDGKGCN
ncbi:MAG TPA: FecR family protein [Parafilimonas sp.]